VPLVKTAIDSCMGLVAVDEESATVRLVHYSIQEYFQRESQTIFPRAECTVAKLCLTFLLLDDFSPGPSQTKRKFDQRAKAFPFLSYAAIYWGEHLRGGAESDLNDLVVRFLESRPKLLCSVQVLTAKRKHWIHNYGKQRMQGVFAGLGEENATPLNVAAKFGLASVTSVLLARKANVEGENKVSWTAVHSVAEVC
jgi:hypothetical protein